MKRDISIDFIRGFAVFLMLMGHCIQCGQGKAYMDSCDFYDNIFFKFIYAFHMPLFALISGYLLYPKSIRHPYSKNCKDLISRLVLPAIFWGGVYWLINSGLSGVWSLSALLVNALSFVWFLWTILVCALLFLTIDYLKLPTIPSHLLVFTAFLFLPPVLLTDKIAFLYPFYFLGYIIYRYKGNVISTDFCQFKENYSFGHNIFFNFCCSIMFL